MKRPRMRPLNVDPPLGDQRLAAVLQAFEQELGDEAVAIARLRGHETLQTEDVDKAAFNLLYHHRLGPTLKELRSECDAGGEMEDDDLWSSDDSELENDVATSGGTDGRETREDRRVDRADAAAGLPEGGASVARGGGDAAGTALPQEPAGEKGAAADRGVLLHDVHEVAPRAELASGSTVSALRQMVWTLSLAVVPGLAMSGLASSNVRPIVAAMVALAIAALVRRRVAP